ncbi:MAG: glycosyltransferase family 2 protein, partial [Chloroflexi bacterium]|nr:glycosyltransferase family 2 protein [Chloroflexota bacterium]
EGNNRAAELAKGRYLVFLNQDTIAHYDWLAEMVRVMESDSSIKAGHAVGCQLHDGYMELQAHIERGYICEVSRFGTVIPVEISLPLEPILTLHLGGGSMILDRDVVAELEYIFDPSFNAYCEDLDLGLRLNGLGHQVVFVPTAVCYHDRKGRAKPTRKTIQRTALATKNRFLAYMKNMYADEFLLTLPFLYLGSITKMSTMVPNRLNRIIYALGLMPFTGYYLLKALWQMPRYKDDRRRILNSRDSHHGRRWLLNELKKKGEGKNDIVLTY